MDTFHFDEVENSLLPFRIGRRLILDQILEVLATGIEIREPALFLSRMFVRLKSADSILEKIKRKKLPVQTPEDIPAVMDDILGFRLIVENQAELRSLDTFLTRTFEVKSIAKQPQNRQFGGQSIDYALVHEQSGKKYPFEVQLRTFLQHYWAAHSFFLFHKADPAAALPYQKDLLALNSALQSAEEAAERIQAGKKESPRAGIETAHWQSWPLRTNVHLMVIEPHEQFVNEQLVSLRGNDDDDHRMIVQSKMSCYEQYPRAAVVECMCANFAAFLLNEPQVHVGPEYLEKAGW
jgi:ppGpp synthetase/RelA/SpoT-type nucleotidyltranferase